MNKTSIIILTYNNLAYNKGVLESIRKYTTQGTYEIIMIDNASTDGTREWLQDQSNIKFVLNNENVGFPKGCNIGIAHAEADSDILLLNNDIEVTHNWLVNLQTALYSNANIGAVQGLEGTKFPQAKDKKGEIIDFLTKDTTDVHQFAIKNNVSDSSRWKYTNFLCGFCFLIKRDVLTQIGLLDEYFSPGFYEDDDMSFRILKAGYYLLKCYDCFIHHFGSQSFGENQIEQLNLMNVNSRKFINKWGFDAWERNHKQPDLLQLLYADESTPINVLHVGCGLGLTLLEVKSRYPLAQLYGIESNEKHKSIIENIIEVSNKSITAFPLEFDEGVFDYILIGKSLGQFENINHFLTSVKKYLKPDGHLIFNVQNVMHYSIFKKMLNGHWKCGKGAVLNSEDVTLLSSSDINIIARECGYKDVLIFHWWNYNLSEEDETFISKLCELTSKDKDYVYRTPLFTVRFKNNQQLPEKANLELDCISRIEELLEGKKQKDIHYLEIGEDLYFYSTQEEVRLDTLDNHFDIDVTSISKINLLSELPTNKLYKRVIVPMYMNLLTKKEVFEFIDKLLMLTQNTLLIGIDDKEEGVLGIPDFKDYDITYYQLENQRHLFKIYKRAKNELTPLFPLINETRLLTILYVMPHRNLTGGMKMLYEQAKLLQKRGHKIQILNSGRHDQMPDWVKNFTPDEEITVAKGASILNTIFSASCDIIFSGWYQQLRELENSKIPVFYWEQGHEWLFGDVKQERNSETWIRQDQLNNYKRNVYLASNSGYVKDVMKTRFQKDSYILPCVLDTNFWHPLAEKVEKEVPTILLVGNPYMKFKGFDKALLTLEKVWKEGIHFRVEWICQGTPTLLKEYPFEIKFQVNLPQIRLPEVYRHADVLLTCSWYEGFSMPSLEAMAAGVAVVATNMGGISQFSSHGENIMVAELNSVAELAQHLKTVLTDHELKGRLIKNGLKAAKELSGENISLLLERLLVSVVMDYEGKQGVGRVRNGK